MVTDVSGTTRWVWFTIRRNMSSVGGRGLCSVGGHCLCSVGGHCLCSVAGRCLCSVAGRCLRLTDIGINFNLILALPLRQEMRDLASFVLSTWFSAHVTVCRCGLVLM